MSGKGSPKITRMTTERTRNLCVNPGSDDGKGYDRPDVHAQAESRAWTGARPPAGGMVLRGVASRVDLPLVGVWTIRSNRHPHTFLS
jgi:hypothetical protein